jgi:hypothetical protein
MPEAAGEGLHKADEPMFTGEPSESVRRNFHLRKATDAVGRLQVEPAASSASSPKAASNHGVRKFMGMLGAAFGSPIGSSIDQDPDEANKRPRNEAEGEKE